MAKKTQETQAQTQTQDVTAEAPQVEIPSELAMEALADFVKPIILAIVKAKKTGKLQVGLVFKEGIIGDEISTFFFPTQTI